MFVNSRCGCVGTFVFVNSCCGFFKSCAIGIFPCKCQILVLLCGKIWGISPLIGLRNFSPVFDVVTEGCFYGAGYVER